MTHRYPYLLTQITHARMLETYKIRQQRLIAIKTKAQALKHKLMLQKKIKNCFGAFPKKTPLNPVITKIVEFPEYRIECIKFESRPTFFVSANLYLPKKIHNKLPTVLLPCGHDQAGKSSLTYSKACLRLVNEGYAVFIYDPINQGERKIYSLIGFPQENPKKFNATIGHNHIGKQMRACGESLSSWMAWDGIRALDYLVTRKEVDPNKIGVTGNSGGGALSAYLWSLDNRIKLVASSCWTTSYINDIENEMAGDNEQYPNGFMAEGLDKIDFFIARAGEPTLLLGQERDFFDDRGLKNGYQELLRIHKLLGGSAKTCKLQMDTITHSYSAINQKEMVQFFNETNSLRKPHFNDNVTLPELSQTFTSPLGDLHKDGSTPLYQLLKQISLNKRKSRPRLSKSQLIKSVIDVLKIKLPINCPQHRRTHGEGRWVEDTKDNKFKIYRFVVETEPNLLLPLRHITKKPGPFRLDVEAIVNLYIPDLCSQKELEDGTVKIKDALWMLDVRGMGEGLFVPDDVTNYYGMEYLLAGHAYMFKETILGSRISDVLTVIKLFKEQGVKKILLSGNGQGAVIALFVALLEPIIASVKVNNAPESIEKLVSTPECYWLDAVFPFDVLSHFDLPDINKALGNKLISCKCGSAKGWHTKREFKG